jgi:predicted dehydrogenase
MATRRVRAGIIGTGFMGGVHLEALRRLGTVDVVAVAGSRIEKARAFADAAGIDKAEADYRTLLADHTIDVVHVCTPNASHFAMASAAVEAGKHVMCEKPLAMTSGEAASLSAAAAAKQVRHATCYNLRFYPMVQQMRCMRQAGEFGDILVAQGTYSQDWLLYDTDWNWRVEAKSSGPCARSPTSLPLVRHARTRVGRADRSGLWISRRFTRRATTRPWTPKTTAACSLHLGARARRRSP